MHYGWQRVGVLNGTSPSLHAYCSLACPFIAQWRMIRLYAILPNVYDSIVQYRLPLQQRTIPVLQHPSYIHCARKGTLPLYCAPDHRCAATA